MLKSEGGKARKAWLSWLKWRAAGAARQAPPISAVRPGDVVMLSKYVDAESPWLETDKPVELGHLVAAAAKLDRSAQKIADRLKALGYDVRATPPQDVQPGDQLLVSSRLNGWPSWLPSTELISAEHVLRAAAATNRTPGDVMARFAALGYRIADALPDTAAGPADRALVSRYLDAESPWLEADKPVEFGHLVAAAAKTDRSAREVAARLTALGYRLPEVDLPDAFPGDELLVSCRVNGWPHWLAPSAPVSADHVLRAAAITRRSPSEIAGRLLALGYRLPDAPPDSAVHADDIVLLSKYVDSDDPWLETDEPVEFGHLVAAAAKTDCSVREVAARLSVLGYRVPEVDSADVVLGDELLVSSRVNGWPVWLSPAKRVPVDHVLRAAVITGRTPGEVAGRLAALGYRVSGVPPQLRGRSR
ncbi:hypothetical protein P3T35_005665 [Kitasatospora sp. GP30]|nr:hypothetical protein [Kitasatospora sp. GP30]